MVVKFIIGIFFLVYALGNWPFNFAGNNISFSWGIFFVLVFWLFFSWKELYEFDSKKNNESIVSILFLGLLQIWLVLILFNKIYAVLAVYLAIIPNILFMSVLWFDSQDIWNFNAIIVYILPPVIWIFISSLIIQEKLKKDAISLNPSLQSKENEPKLVSTIRTLPVSDVEGIRFFENWGNKYLIKIDSIKKIAKYLEYKYKKTTFAPGELTHEREYLIENYASNLSKANYDLVIKTLTDWVDKGGRFEFVLK